jgi:hypothetical protein
MGGKVYAAEYEGNSWSSPAAISPQAAFHKEAAVAFDSYDRPMAVWSRASNDGLDYEKSSAGEILSAMDTAELVYARRIDGVWTCPEILAALPGTDEQVSLAAGPCGEIMAAWINQSGSSSAIYGCLWDGSRWAEPVRIAEAALADAPKVVYTLRKPLVIWAQDHDGRVDTPHDWRLYMAAWDDASWSVRPLHFDESSQD